MTKFHGPNIAGKTMFWMSENKWTIYRVREHWTGNSAHRPVSQHQPSNGQQCSTKTKTKHQHLSVQLESINHKELYAQSLVPVYVQQWAGNTGLSLDHQAARTLAAILLLARGPQPSNMTMYRMQICCGLWMMYSLYCIRGVLPSYFMDLS